MFDLYLSLHVPFDSVEEKIVAVEVEMDLESFETLGQNQKEVEAVYFLEVVAVEVVVVEVAVKRNSEDLRNSIHNYFENFLKHRVLT